NRFGEIFDTLPIFESEESETSLLTNTSRCHKIFGYPKVSLDQMIEWIAYWVQINGITLNKPTKFEIRNGQF
ncbi:TPA: epimerase, partial [Candidatus Poribacteria bacterium]|nr:epimerase [Candidatus Poribacteria bacterium]